MSWVCACCGEGYLPSAVDDSFCGPCKQAAMRAYLKAGRCKNCRHWADPKQQTWWDSFAKWGQCAKTNVDENDSPLMIAEVNPVRFIPVTTREDFGCVMFEAKGAE